MASDTGKSLGTSDKISEHLVHNLIAGSLSRFVAVAALHPLDVVKTRLQYQREQTTSAPSQHYKTVYTSGTHVFTSVLRDEGPRALYKGLGVRLAYILPAAGVNFTSTHTSVPPRRFSSSDSYLSILILQIVMILVCSGRVARLSSYLDFVEVASSSRLSSLSLPFQHLHRFMRQYHLNLLRNRNMNFVGELKRGYRMIALSVSSLSESFLTQFAQFEVFDMLISLRTIQGGIEEE